MDRYCDGIIERETDVLRRIVATLVALAVLADRMCSQSRNAFALWALSNAETVVAEFISDILSNGDQTATFDLPEIDDLDDSAEAARLAHSFRTLAFMLAAIVLQLEGATHRFKRTNSSNLSVILGPVPRIYCSRLSWRRPRPQRLTLRIQQILRTSPRMTAFVRARAPPHARPDSS